MELLIRLMLTLVIRMDFNNDPPKPTALYHYFIYYLYKKKIFSTRASLVGRHKMYSIIIQKFTYESLV